MQNSPTHSPLRTDVRAHLPVEDPDGEHDPSKPPPPPPLPDDVPPPLPEGDPPPQAPPERVNKKRASS